MVRIVFFILIGTFPIVMVIALYLKYKKEKQTLNTKRETDVKIIKIAQQQNGVITTLDVITKLHLSVDEAQAELERLYEKGIFRVEVNEKGGVYYELNKSL